MVAKLVLCLLCCASPADEPKSAEPGPASIEVLVRTVDLDRGESQEIELADGSQARLKLLELTETRDELRGAVREARVRVAVNGVEQTLVSGLYQLPVAVGGVQIDCPVTRGYTARSSKQNAWSLKKDARFRLWPARSPWLQPGTFVYPIKQRWFAGQTQMSNEPVFVDGGEVLGQGEIYYHYGLDFGGAESLAEVVAATDGLVVSAAGKSLPDLKDSPIDPRYDVIHIVDGRGWFYRYSHLATLDVKPGQRVKMGQRLGLLGKEGGSGGWSHLHFDIDSRQPSGEWGKQDAYAYAWEAYRRQYAPKLIAVARPHHLAAVGQKITLDGSKSWAEAGKVRFQWSFSDGSTATGPKVDRLYSVPGVYSETLKVVDDNGRQAWDFATVEVVDPQQPKQLPPTIHASYHPTFDIKAGDAITFKVRSFRTTHGDESWDFGDGSPAVHVKSDGNAKVHAKDGYATTEHRFAEPGDYLVSVQRANERGQMATARLHVHVAKPADR